MIINRKRIPHLQAFKVIGHDEYIYAWMDTMRGSYYDVCASLTGDTLPNCHTKASHEYLRGDCYPVSFAELPPYAQAHIAAYAEL